MIFPLISHELISIDCALTFIVYWSHWQDVFKEFWQDAGSRGADFSWGKINVTPTAVKSASAVPLMLLLIFLLRTIQQWLAVLFSWSDCAKISNPNIDHFPRGIWTHILYVVPWSHPSHPSKRHFERFSRFCRAHKYDQQTHSYATIHLLGA